MKKLITLAITTFCVISVIAQSAEKFTFAPFTAGTKGYCYAISGPTDGTALTNNAIYYTSLNGPANDGKDNLNPYKTGIVFAPAVDVTMAVTLVTGSSARTLTLRIEEIQNDYVWNAFVKCAGEQNAMPTIIYNTLTDDTEKQWWIDNAGGKVITSKGVAGTDDGSKKYMSGESESEGMAKTVATADQISVAKETTLELESITVENTPYVFSKEKKYRLYLTPSSSTGLGLGEIMFTAVGGGTIDPTPTCTEADATFAATATNLSIEAGQTEATTTLTFTKGLNTSDATFAVLKDGKATEDATVAGNVFTATAAGEYTVKATQEFDETYCQVVKEVVITVTDNRPAPVTIFEWEKKGSNGFSEDNTDLSVDTQGTLTIGTSVVGRKFGGNNVDNNSKGYKLGNNDVCIEIQGTSDFEIGDIVTITGVGGGSGERGFSIAPVTTTDAKTDVENTNLIDDSSNKNEYTVVVTGKQAGEKLRIFRLDGKTMYLYGIKVVRPADDGTANLAVNPESVDLNVTAVESNPTATVRFSGKNLTPNTYNLVVPQVAGLTVTPSQVVVGEDGKLNTEVVLAYTSTVDVAAAVAELSLTIDDLNAKVVINYSAELAKEYATSLNIEQLVLDNGVGYDIKAALDAANIEYSKIDALDSLNDEKGDLRNYAFMGLKLKTSGATIGLWLKQGSTLNVRLGNMGADVKVSGAGEEETLTADQYANIDNDADNKVYTYPAADADAYVLFTTTGSGTVVFKQIMIDEDIAAVTLPAKPGTGTALDNTAAAQKAHKVVRDGQLLIIRDGKTYTAQGVELK